MKASLALANLTAVLSTMTAERIKSLKTEDPNLYRALDQIFGTGGITSGPLEAVNWPSIAALLRQVSETSISYASQFVALLQDKTAKIDDATLVARVKDMFADKDLDLATVRSQIPVFEHLDANNTASIELVVRNRREDVIQALDYYDAGEFRKQSGGAGTKKAAS